MDGALAWKMDAKRKLRVSKCQLNTQSIVLRWRHSALVVFFWLIFEDIYPSKNKQMTYRLGAIWCTCTCKYWFRELQNYNSSKQGVIISHEQQKCTKKFNTNYVYMYVCTDHYNSKTLGRKRYFKINNTLFSRQSLELIRRVRNFTRVHNFSIDFHQRQLLTFRFLQ